jgi:hypothetical protein
MSRWIIAVFAALVAITLFFVWHRVSFQPKPKAVETLSSMKLLPTPAVGPDLVQNPARNSQRKTAVQNTLAMLGTPITFYGKVLDQNGLPVSHAVIDYGLIDRFDADGSKYSGKSDASGNFSIQGIKGAVLTVGVMKSGYYNIHGKSNASFAYGIGADATRKPPPTRENPAVFVLQKMGATEPLIQIKSRQFDVPKSGRPLLIDLATGRMGRGDLQIESWIGNSTDRRFDWRYRLSVPGGGLVVRNGQFDFEAPADGYLDFIELGMTANSAAWTSDFKKDYFVKLADGKYARLAINYYPGDRNFVVLDSYLNPRPGSRNLEFDPAKQIKPR